MRSTGCNCIILGNKNISENDKFIFLYTKEFGKLRVVAKGSRKITSKFTGHIETLNICSATLYVGPKNTLLTEITSKNLLGKNTNIETASAAFNIAEISDKLLFENQNIEGLYDLLSESIKHLCKTKKPRLIAFAYMLKLLDMTGLIPDYKKIESKIDKKYLKFFQYLKNKPLNEIKKITLTKSEEAFITLFLKDKIEKETEQHFRSFF